MRGMRHASIPINGAQTNTFNVQCRLRLRKAAPASHTDRCEWRNLGSLALGPVGFNMQASISPRSQLGILAERTGLIAKKSPPRLSRPSASCRQVA
jgi:hypothetical protein